MVSTAMRAQDMSMATVGRLIRARRRELGLTLQAAADLVGCAKSYLSTIENERRTSPPSTRFLCALERALRMEEGVLLSAGRWQSTPGEIRREMLDLRSDRFAAKRLADLLARQDLDEMHRSGELRTLIDRLGGDAEPDAGGNIGAPQRMPMQVPLINQVAAGYPTEFTDLDYPVRIADEYVSVPDVADPDAFAARVVGDSMSPDYREGDIVVFSPRVDATNGSDCFVRLSQAPPHAGESTFKRVYFEPLPGRASDREHAEEQPAGEADESNVQIRLQPLNSAFPPVVVPRESVEGLYRAVYVVREVGVAGDR